MLKRGDTANTRVPSPPKKSFQRFSLRTLFFVSFLLMAPFLLASLIGTDFQTADAGGAPIFLAMRAGILQNWWAGAA